MAHTKAETNISSIASSWDLIFVLPQSSVRWGYSASRMLALGSPPDKRTIKQKCDKVKQRVAIQSDFVLSANIRDYSRPRPLNSLNNFFTLL